MLKINIKVYKEIKLIFLGLFLIIINSFFISPVVASTCRNYDQDLICILSIKRSAKYYWRYRTEISINGIKKPMTIYDCRQKMKIAKNGSLTPFSQNGIENLICKTLNK